MPIFHSSAADFCGKTAPPEQNMNISRQTGNSVHKAGFSLVPSAHCGCNILLGFGVCDSPKSEIKICAKRHRSRSLIQISFKLKVKAFQTFRLTRNVQILRECADFPQKSGCNSVKCGHLSEIVGIALTRREKLT